jgi:YggT family protein
MLERYVEPIYVDYWFYFLPDWALACVMWTCFGRFLLSLFVAPASTNYIWRFFCRITDPAMALTGRITPGFVHPAFMPLVAAFWVFVARYLFWMVMYNLQLAPRLSDYGVVPGS